MPSEKLFTALVKLFLVAFVRQVLSFEGILGEVEELVWLVVVVVDVLLEALYARHTPVGVDAAGHDGAILWQGMEQRIAWIFSVLYLVAQHLQHGRQDVDLAR